MSKIWEFFENLGEYVYVADAETHELIYMNKKTLKSYGFQSLEEIIGLPPPARGSGVFSPGQ